MFHTSYKKALEESYRQNRLKKLKKPQFHTNRVVFFGGIPKTTFEKTIKLYFQNNYGPVDYVFLDQRVSKNKKGDLSSIIHRGSGFIQFSFKESAKLASNI